MNFLSTPALAPHEPSGRLQWGRGWLGPRPAPPLRIHPVTALCWQKARVRHALELPKIAKDQDVPGSGQLQTQGVAGRGNLANFPPAHGAGLSPGPAWTGSCRQGHTDPRPTRNGVLGNALQVKFGYSSSSSKKAHGPPSAIHHQARPGATQV